MSTNFPAVMNPQDLAAALANSQIQPTQSGGVSYLKMSETGEWTLGRKEDIVTDEEILINTPTIQHGWIIWSGNRKTAIWGRFNTPIPLRLNPIGEDQAKEGRMFLGSMIDDGEPISFDTNSQGGCEGVDILFRAIELHSAAGSFFVYPKVKLVSTNYINKNYGNKLTFKPSFPIVAWCDEAGNEEPAAPKQIENGTDSTGSTEESAPRRRRRTKKEMQEAAEQQKTTPENEPAPEGVADADLSKQRRHRRQRSSAA